MCHDFQTDRQTDRQTDSPDIAFLLMVHANPEQVNRFIGQLLRYENSWIYIHVDAKNPGMIDQLTESDRVFILPEHIDCQWGDYSQVRAYKYLIEYAVKHRHHDFYSMHSGADLAIRPVEEYAAYLKEQNLYAWTECQKLPNGWQFAGGFGRIALNWPDCFKKSVGRHSPIRYLRSMYGRLYGAGILRSRKLPDQYTYYGGGAWFTIRRDCAEDFLDFTAREQAFEELFVHALSGDEIYFVSVFQMTKGDRPVCSTNMLRYVDWAERGQKQRPGSPNTLQMDFVDDIEASDAFFARKFDPKTDLQVIEYFLRKTGASDSDEKGA